MVTRVAKKTAKETAVPPVPVAAKRATAKTAVSAPRKPARAQSIAVVPPQVRQQMIEEAAYARYVARGYAHGYSLIDWLEAEAEVDRRLAGG